MINTLHDSFNDYCCTLQGVVLLGHSTGCQDAVRYVQLHSKAAGAAHLAGVVLQAAVMLLLFILIVCLPVQRCKYVWRLQAYTHHFCAVTLCLYRQSQWDVDFGK